MLDVLKVTVNIISSQEEGCLCKELINVNENSVDFITVCLTEMIISWKWLIKANPGVKDFAQTEDWTQVSPSSQPVVIAMSYKDPICTIYLIPLVRQKYI